VLKRRTVLAGGAVVAVGAAAGAAALGSRANRQRLKDVLGELTPPPRDLDHNAATGALTPAEALAVAALAEVLYPPDATPEAIALGRAHAATRCEKEPGYLPEYRRAVQLLDERAAAARSGKTFAALTREQRDAVLHALLWDYSGRRFVGTMGRLVENATASEEASALRRFVVADLLQAFYSSGYGWAVVGYTHYPGVPAADPLDYTKPLRG
jgi:hypothetical protein